MAAVVAEESNAGLAVPPNHRAGSFLGGLKGQRTDIEFRNLKLTLAANKKRSEKTILSGVSGTIKHNRFTALMGPSGSGKTSLLNVLAGRTLLSKGLTLEGEILANGKVITNWSQYRRKCAYVEQDDLLYHTLTVRETIMLAADLRLPKSMTKAQRVERVDLVIAELGLRKCQDTIIGNARMRGVSGGERKRVSIAIEILRGPSVLFLDECTTGLDSFQALRVATTIKELAQEGRTIVSSIHQPRSSIFALFDDVILLSEGKMIYYGPGADIVDYFSNIGHHMPENFNPGDFILDLVSIDLRTEKAETESRQRLLTLEEAFKPVVDKSPEAIIDPAVTSNYANVKSEDVVESKYETSRSRQFYYLLQRAYRQKTRDRKKLIAPFISTVFFALLLGFLYFRTGKNLTQQAIQDKAGVLFFLVLNQSMSGMFAMLTVFPDEKHIINRERSSKSYALAPFFYSRILVDLPMIIFPWLMVTIVYFLASFKMNAAAYFQTVFTCIIGHITATNLGLFVSSLAPSSPAAIGMAMPFMLIFILFSGFYANNSLIPDALNWIQWISPIRWLFASVCVIQFSGLTFECNTGPTNCIPTGDAFLNRLGLGDDSFGRSFGVLAGFSVFLNTAAYMTLRFKRTKWITPKTKLE